jgi:amino-acid N-acetyltransferase
MRTFSKVREDEFTSVLQLISDNKLPVEDLDETKLRNFLVARESDKIIACGGLEFFGTEALLRSLSVKSSDRNKGLGSQVLKKLIEFAAGSGVNNLHLLTTTAEKFFLKHGFISVDRKYAPPVIQNSSEFSWVCPSAGSIYMRLNNILQDKEQGNIT